MIIKTKLYTLTCYGTKLILLSQKTPQTHEIREKVHPFQQLTITKLCFQKFHMLFKRGKKK